MSELTWRYCVTLTRTEAEDTYEIRELYIDGDGALSWTEGPSSPTGVTWLELAEDSAHMDQAISSGQVLDITDPANPQWVGRTLGRKTRG